MKIRKSESSKFIKSNYIVPLRLWSKLVGIREAKMLQLFRKARPFNSGTQK